MEKLREIKQPVTEAENRLRENRLRVLEKRQINRSSARGKRGKRRKRKKTLKK